MISLRARNSLTWKFYNPAPWPASLSGVYSVLLALSHAYHTEEPCVSHDLAMHQKSWRSLFNIFFIMLSENKGYLFCSEVWHKCRDFPGIFPSHWLASPILNGETTLFTILKIKKFSRTGIIVAFHYAMSWRSHVDICIYKHIYIQTWGGDGKNERKQKRKKISTKTKTYI